MINGLWVIGGCAVIIAMIIWIGTTMALKAGYKWRK